jgi:hypothetical protein
MNKKTLKKFDLEQAIAGGPLKVSLGNHLDLDNIILPANPEGYLIYIKYNQEEKKYKFSVYEKRKEFS